MLSKFSKYLLIKILQYITYKPSLQLENIISFKTKNKIKTSVKINTWFYIYTIYINTNNDTQ